MIGCRNRGGRRGCRSWASINASTASAAALRSTPATSAVSASEASSPRIASARATDPTVGERRLSRAATKRATDGGPIAAIVPASRPRRARSSSGRDELAGEQRVAAGRSRALGADLVARLLAEVAADQLGNGRRAERQRPDRRRAARARSAWSGRPAPPRSRRSAPRGSRTPGSPRSSPRGRRGTAANARRAQCASSTSRASGRTSASLAHSQCRPWKRANRRSSAAARSGNVLEQRARQSRGAGEDPVALALAERLDRRRQQPDHHAERELALHHAATRAQHGHPTRLGQLRGLGHQRALADPRRALDHDGPTGPGRGGAQRAVDLRQFGLALEQVGPAVEVRHPRRAGQPSCRRKPTVAPRSEARPTAHTVAAHETTLRRTGHAGARHVQGGSCLRTPGLRALASGPSRHRCPRAPAGCASGGGTGSPAVLRPGERDRLRRR